MKHNIPAECFTVKTMDFLKVHVYFCIVQVDSLKVHVDFKI
jgi:hypothetical protein